MICQNRHQYVEARSPARHMVFNARKSASGGPAVGDREAVSACQLLPATQNGRQEPNEAGACLRLN